MTESTTSPQLTTEQLAGAEANEAAPADAGTTSSSAEVTTAGPARTDGGPSGNVTIQGRRSLPASEEGSAPASGDGSPLLANNTEFMARWTAIQATFVDEPRTAVEQADTLVAEVIRELARVFADERGRLEGAWSRGTDVSTEDLRQALRRYRDFFHLLLRS